MKPTFTARRTTTTPTTMPNAFASRCLVIDTGSLGAEKERACNLYLAIAQRMGVQPH